MRWLRRRFGELAEFRNGLNFSAADRGGELPVLGVAEFGSLSLRSSEELETVRMPTDTGRVSFLEPGDLVFVRSNGSRDLVGRCMFIESLTRPTSHSGFTIRARVTNEELNPRWAAAVFQSGMADRAFGRGTPGTNISNVTQGILASVELPVPPRRVQDALLQVLERAELARTQVKKLLTAKRAFKRSLMQDLLTGRRRFREFGGEPWEGRPLGHFLREKAVRNGDGAVQLVYSCSKLYGIIPQSNRFKHRVAAKNVTNYKIVEPGDLVFDPMLLWDASIGFVPPGIPGVVSPAYTTLSLTADSGSRAFLAHALFSHYARHMYRVASRGTNVRRKKVLTSDFLRIRIPVPPTQEEQIRVAAVLDAADREIQALLRQRELLGDLKRGLMQRLLSGDLDLPDALVAGFPASTPDTGGNDDDS